MISAERTKQLVKDLFEIADPTNDEHKEIMENISQLLEDSVANYSESFEKHAIEYAEMNKEEVAKFNEEIDKNCSALSPRQKQGVLKSKSSL